MISEAYTVSCTSCIDRFWNVPEVSDHDELKCPDCGSKGDVTSREVTVRGKWIFSGCGSVQEMAKRLEERAEYLQGLDKEGYRLVDGGDDYWTLRMDPGDLPMGSITS